MPSSFRTFFESEDMSEETQVTRNAAIFGGATVLSRILGLVRTALIASAFGTSLAASAFFFAYSIPNMLRRLSGEGALGGAFIPVFTEELEKRGQTAAIRLANSVALIVSLILAGVLVVMALALQATSFFFAASKKTVLVAQLTQLMLPYLFFISLAGFGMAVLNSLNHFFMPAISPAIHNMVLIAALIFLCPLMGQTKEQMVYGLAIGVIVGGAIQLAILYYPLKKKGYVLNTGVYFRGESLRKVSRLFLPGVFGLAVSQINAVVDKLLGFFVRGHETSAPSELFYANLIVELPLAVFGVSLGVAVFPSLSRLWASQRMKDFKRTLSSALRQAMAISFPATVGLVLLREPVIRVIYQRKAFGAAAAEAVAPVLTGYAVGLFAYTAAKIVVPAFLSLQDSRTPMRVGLAMTLLNLGLNCVAVFALRIVWGLALSTSLCAALQTVILLYILRKKIGLLGGRQIVLSVLRIAVATAFMGIVVHGALKVAGHVSPGTGGWANLVGLLLPTVCGLLSYPLFCHLFRVGELRDVFRAFRKGESE